ncbi:MAG: hypothetical protein K9G41_10310 [Flavobacteriales bacterium]|nr:hypothetical protein [Flavobacteriales bacterium]
MPLEINLNFDFSEAQKADIHAALDALIAAFNEPPTPYVNLTRKERKRIPSIHKARMPYVSKTIKDMLPIFPDLQSPSIPLERATRLLQLMLFMQSIEPKLAEIQDHVTDMGINAEFLVYKSMTDSYNTAKQHEGRMPGADVLLEALAPLFAKPQNP